MDQIDSYFLYKLLARIGGIEDRPASTRQEPYGRRNEAESGEAKSDYQAWWKRSPFGDAGRVDHADNRNVFRFFNACHFELLREKFEYGFLHANVAIEVGEWDRKPRKLA